MFKAITAAVFGLLLGLGAMQANALAEGKHQLLLHVDENDKALMNLVLNNAANVVSHYLEKGDEVQVEIVAYGPGLNMLVEAKSPVKERVTNFTKNFPNVSFKACGNTHRKMSKKAGKEVKLLPQAEMVQAGVVHLMERQEEGWSYVRP